MPISKARRVSVLALAVLLALLPVLSPLLDVYGEHDHSCSANKCILCLASGAISILRDIAFFAVISAAAAMIAVPVRLSFNRHRAVSDTSPVLLKNKITS